MPRFKLLAHPSDIGIVAYGSTKKEIFENAAYGMFSIMADLKKVKALESLEIKIAGDDWESLMVNWLNELVYYVDAKKMLFVKFRINKINATQLEAAVSGEKIDLGRHSISRPIKAATYNQLQIRPKQAKIVFDV